MSSPQPYLLKPKKKTLMKIPIPVAKDLKLHFVKWLSALVFNPSWSNNLLECQMCHKTATQQTTVDASPHTFKS